MGDRIVLNARQYTKGGFLHLLSGPDAMRHLQRMESAHSFVAHLLRLALQLSAAMAATNQDKEDERSNSITDMNDNCKNSFILSAQFYIY